jgi:hypothetical protein
MSGGSPCEVGQVGAAGHGHAPQPNMGSTTPASIAVRSTAMRHNPESSAQVSHRYNHSTDCRGP